MAVEDWYYIGTTGNNGVECRVYVSLLDDAANNRSSIDAELQIRKSNGFTSQGNMSGTFQIDWDSDQPGPTGIKVEGNKTLPGNGAWVSMGAAGRQYFTHEKGGNFKGTVYVNVNSVAMSGSSDYDTPISASLAFAGGGYGFTDYNVLPLAPSNLSIRANSVTTNSFGVDYQRNSYDSIDMDHVYWATDPGFTNVVWIDDDAAGFSQPSTATPVMTLMPGTTYYVRVYSHTAAGWGPVSSTISQTTLPADPPGLTVSSSPSGSQATLAFSPPGGVTGVTKYAYERRATGTSTPVTAKETTTNVVVESGLTPGSSYDWRASAWIGGYQSPWTTWQTLAQAKPNTNPGDYFDGSTVDITDIDYSWTGTANASTSIATAKGVAGWEGSFPGGSGILYRVTAGLFSPYAARMQIMADTTGVGVRVGQENADPYRTEVTEGATYIGSIHVRPSRSQRLVAELTWLDASGALVGTRVTGAPSVVAGETWARLVGGGTAPSGAVRAVIRAIDVTGTGWSKWLSGETMDLDAAMISLNEEFPYFDGSFLPDGTYVYEWDDVPHLSVSTRTPVASAGPGAFMPELGGLFLPSRLALTDPDCTIVPPPPRPPSVPSDCIEDVGVWRRYYTEIPANLVPEWLDVVPTIEIISAAYAARQVRIRYYSNEASLPAEQVDTSSWIAEQIISFMPAQTVMTLDGVTQHVWAEINASDPVSADHLLYGTNGKPATWPVFSCGIAYLVSIEVPISEPAGNISVAAALTARA
ncbi:MAG TPA: fibronectin type III domain-containing protein [Ornithinibacter sp.]|nr:fibronectin type III domain-containing protein [Ornithinibacter sp.]